MGLMLDIPGFQIEDPTYDPKTGTILVRNVDPTFEWAPRTVRLHRQHADIHMTQGVYAALPRIPWPAPDYQHECVLAHGQERVRLNQDSAITKRLLDRYYAKCDVCFKSRKDHGAWPTLKCLYGEGTFRGDVSRELRALKAFVEKLAADRAMHDKAVEAVWLTHLEARRHDLLPVAKAVCTLRRMCRRLSPAERHRLAAFMSQMSVLSRADVLNYLTRGTPSKKSTGPVYKGFSL